MIRINMKMPKCCGDCRVGFCMQIGCDKHLGFDNYHIERHPDCPLKEVPTGHWIRVDKNKVRCSACEVIHLIAQYPNGKIDWCPNCGAKMVEPRESGDKE